MFELFALMVSLETEQNASSKAVKQQASSQCIELSCCTLLALIVPDLATPTSVNEFSLQRAFCTGASRQHPPPICP